MHSITYLLTHMEKLTKILATLNLPKIQKRLVNLLVSFLEGLKLSVKLSVSNKLYIFPIIFQIYESKLSVNFQLFSRANARTGKMQLSQIIHSRMVLGVARSQVESDLSARRAAMRVQFLASKSGGWTSVAKTEA